MSKYDHKPNKQCEVCKTPYFSYEKKQKYCSIECYRKTKAWLKYGSESHFYKTGRPPCPDCGGWKQYKSLRCRKCHDKWKTGERHHSWKGGLRGWKYLFRRTKAYKEWRTAVFQRDNYTCQICGVRGVYLEADHIKRFAEYPELRLELSNGRTLCLPCHKKTDTWGTKGMKDFKKTKN